MSAGTVDFGYGTGGQLVDELAENLSVSNDIFIELTGGEFFSCYSLNPFLSFLVLLGVAFGSNLSTEKSINGNTYIMKVKSLTFA